MTGTKEVSHEKGAKHTPGPWRVEGRENGVTEVWSHRTSGHSTIEREAVAVVIGKHAEAKDDARLIAAAPDLLKAAKATLAMLDTSSPGIGHYQLRDAIAKAEGK